MTRRVALRAAERLPRVWQARLSKWLYRRLWRRYAINPNRFQGHHVLILGPAAGGLKDLDGLAPRSYDDVVRLNNGLDTEMLARGIDPYRTDILFHSLTQDARPVTPETLRRAGVRLLVHRLPSQGVFLRALAAEAKFRTSAGVEIGVIPMAQFNALRAALGGSSPSSGMVCLDFFLSAPVASLTVVGFTFLRTRYVPGYDDRFETDAEAFARVVSVGHHDPEAEARWVQERCRAAQMAGLDLCLGAGMEAALAHEKTGAEGAGSMFL